MSEVGLGGGVGFRKEEMRGRREEGRVRAREMEIMEEKRGGGEKRKEGGGGGERGGGNEKRLITSFIYIFSIVIRFKFHFNSLILIHFSSTLFFLKKSFGSIFLLLEVK